MIPIYQATVEITFPAITHYLDCTFAKRLSDKNVAAIHSHYKVFSGFEVFCYNDNTALRVSCNSNYSIKESARDLLALLRTIEITKILWTNPIKGASIKSLDLDKVLKD